LAAGAKANVPEMSRSSDRESFLGRAPLGKPANYPDRYDARLLFSIERAAQREAFGIHSPLPFRGADLWTAYELSWLGASGKPELAIAKFRVPADSPAIVESKSLKLYLGSFAQEPIARHEELAQTITRDLRRACNASVEVELVPLTAFAALPVAELPGESLDTLEVAIDAYEPDDTLLRVEALRAEESLRSALFRSRCPVTGQPDYGDILLRYRGPRIERASLLRYLASYRTHAAFHESCVERIFMDVRKRCGPERLTVYARFMRRGGIDINPFRSDFELPPSDVRTPRQ
jgi:7-cyano-7-deazaguanine reductase